MTTLGRTRAAMPAIDEAGRLVLAGGTLPRLKLGSTPLCADLDTM
jgi:hypothetical protein